jgi:hypothetical protein
MPVDGNHEPDVFLATLHGADLSVDVAVDPDPVPSGGAPTYGLGVTDTGPDAADDATVALLLPAGTTFGGVTSIAGTCTPPTVARARLVSCLLGDLAVGAHVDVTVTASVTAPAGASLSALAAMSSGTVDPAPGGNLVAVSSDVG